MSVSSKLESLSELALLDVERLDDEAFLTKDVGRLAQQIAERHYLEPPRFQRAVIGMPRAARLGSPGEPGCEHVLVVQPATRVELWLLVEGFATIARLAEGDNDLELGEAQINVDERCLVVAYVAEHPVAEQANDFFQRSLYDADERMGRLGQQVVAFNEALLPAVTEALQSAKGRAKERRKFAAALTVPSPKEPWENS